MKLQEINTLLYEKHQNLFHRLHSEINGWRGLFDNLCAEWDHCNVPIKVAFLKEINEIIPIVTVVQAYENFYFESPRKRYVLHSLASSLEQLEENGLFEFLQQLELNTKRRIC